MAEVSRLMTVGLNKSRLCRGPPQDYSYPYHLTARSNVTPKQKPSIVSCALCYLFPFRTPMGLYPTFSGQWFHNLRGPFEDL